VVTLRPERTIAQDLVRSTRASSLQAAVEVVAAEARGAGCGCGIGSWISRARHLGVTDVVFTDLGSVDGRLRQLSKEERLIELNVRKPRTRQLFSLAHELGHLLLDRHLAYLGSSLKERSLFHFDYDRQEERLADRLAGAMLMAPERVTALHREYASALTTTVQMATRFSVSLSAAAVRLEEVSQSPFVLLDFTFDCASQSLVLRDGRINRLPFWSSVDANWRIPLASLSCDLRPYVTESVEVGVESFPGVTETYRGEIRWMGNSRVIAAFPALKRP
jgi:hypothetical protein